MKIIVIVTVSIKPTENNIPPVVTEMTCTTSTRKWTHVTANEKRNWT